MFFNEDIIHFSFVGQRKSYKFSSQRTSYVHIDFDISLRPIGTVTNMLTLKKWRVEPLKNVLSSFSPKVFPCFLYPLPPSIFLYLSPSLSSLSLALSLSLSSSPPSLSLPISPPLLSSLLPCRSLLCSVGMKYRIPEVPIASQCFEKSPFVIDWNV